MKPRIRYAAIALMIGGASAGALAQASPKETPFDWLERAVSAASEGCTETYQSPEWSYEHIHSYTITPWADDQFASRLDVYDGAPSGETKAWWSTTLFSADMILTNEIRLIPAEDRVSEADRKTGEDTYAWSCHQLTIILAQPAPYTSADDDLDEISTLSFEVNDWSLGEEMLAAFENLAKSPS